MEDNIFDVDAINNHGDSFELWTPKRGEYCWVWNDNAMNPTPELRKFIETVSTIDGISSKYVVENNPSYIGCGVNTELYECCEPFTGALPSILRRDDDRTI